MIYLEKMAINPLDFLQDASLLSTNIHVEYWGYPEYFKKYESIFNIFFAERFERIMASSPPLGEWLDIGSGFGLWQSYLNTKKQSNYGIEIESKAHQFCQTTGLRCEKISIENCVT